MSLIVLSALSTTALAHGKWDVGVAVGAGMTQTTETLNQSDSSGTSSRYKFKFKGSGPVAGITAGYNVQRLKNIYGFAIGGYKDFYKGRNDGYKKDTLSNTNISSKNDLQRKYTLELVGKLGRLVSDDTELYGKIGVLRSQFQEQFSQATARVDVKRKAGAWGGVAGLGIQKSFETTKVGLEYSYQYYQNMGTTMRYFDVVNIKNVSKFRPQYHNLFLKISKTF